MSESPRKRLPVNPSIEHLKKQAKRRAKLDPSLHLSDAQHHLAKEYGCKNWAELAHVVETMSRGATHLSGYSNTKMEALPAAANQRDIELVQQILASGEFTQHDLDLALARSVLRFDQRGDIGRLLLEHGADPDGQYGANYGPIVFVTGEGLDPEGLQFLIDAGADVTFPPIDTKYGRQCPLSYFLGSYVRGRNDAKHRGIEILLKHGAFIPPEVSPAILALHRGDASSLAKLIDSDASLLSRRFDDMPYGNMSLAGATLLHCVVEFGEIECIDLLLSRGADMNARAHVINGIGGQTPIFHAVATNQGQNFYTLEHLVKRFGEAIDLSIRGTFKLYGEAFKTPVTALQYVESVSGPSTPEWQRASARELDLLRWISIVNAILRDDLETVRQALDSGADVNRRGEHGATALHWAAVEGSAAMVEVLLSRGARNWIADDNGKTALDNAKQRADSPEKDAIVRLLSEVRILDPHFRDAVAAIDRGDIESLKEILREHPNLVRQRAEEEGWFAGPYFRHPMLLHFIANNPNRRKTMPPNTPAATQAILDAGADVDAETEGDNGGATTLALVASSEPAHRDGLQVQLIELLVQNGADPGKGLNAAISHSYFAAVETIVRLGAPHTLMSAAGMGDVDALRRLLQSPQPEASRLAAAQVAAKHGQTACVDLLLATGLDINARLPNPYQPTLLHEAALYGHLSLVEHLLSLGANPAICDKQFDAKPAGWAKHAGHHEVAAVLDRAAS